MSHFVREGAGGATTCAQCSDDIDLERPRGYEKAGEGPFVCFKTDLIEIFIASFCFSIKEDFLTKPFCSFFLYRCLLCWFRWRKAEAQTADEDQNTLFEKYIFYTIQLLSKAFEQSVRNSCEKLDCVFSLLAAHKVRKKP